MARYRIDSRKPVSPLKRYEYLRKKGVVVEGNIEEILSGQDLDDYVDEQVWREAHPGQEPIKEWEDGVPTE